MPALTALIASIYLRQSIVLKYVGAVVFDVRN